MIKHCDIISVVSFRVSMCYKRTSGAVKYAKKQKQSIVKICALILLNVFILFRLTYFSVIIDKRSIFVNLEYIVWS
jgi:hypothetical protein